MLSDGEREYLEEKDLSGAHERTVRSRIRQKTEEALEDFQLLFENLREDDRSQIFTTARERDPEGPKKYNSEDPLPPSMTMYQEVADILSFFILAYYDMRENGGPITDDDLMVQEHLNMLLKEAISRALEKQGRTLDEYEDFSFETDPTEIEELLQRFRDGKPLSYREFQRLQREGSLTDLTDSVSILRKATVSNAGNDEPDLPGRKIIPKKEYEKLVEQAEKEDS